MKVSASPDSPDDDGRDIEIFLNAPEGATAEELAAYLDEACGGDGELRGRVDALFAQNGVTAGIADRVPNISPISQDIESEGATIGPYKLLQKIGEGGFGDVYMAEQLRPVKRRVALKVIKLGMDTKQVVARFEAERQALAMMDHPHIAKVHDAGATETGRPYFVMELVRGIPITKFCDEQNLDTSERLALFVDVCHAVQHAHQKGVIHRDLKPSNVMVTMHDDKPVVKVIDFGVAKATQTDLTDKTLFTQFEQFIGTPAYMSPEQAQFSGLDIDTRSDIYTLGVLLYELLTGTTPFDSKSLAMAGQDEIRRIIKEDEPAIPSSRFSTIGKAELTTLAKHRRTAATRLPSLVKGDLDWIVMKAIEKDRTRRYETANALAADIGRHLADEPVVAAAPSASYRLKKYVNKHRALLTTAAVVITSLLIGTSVSIWKAVEAGHARSVAQDATRSEETLRKAAQADNLIVSHRIAEEKLASGETALGIAHLARLVRDDQNNLVAAERLISAIRKNPQPQIAHVFHLPNATYAIFDDTGSKILVASLSGQAQVWDTTTGEPLSPVIEARGEEMLKWIRFSPDGNHIVLGCSNAANTRSTASLVDWRTGKEIHLPFELESKNQTCEISPDGQLLLMGCPSKACVWNLETGQPWDQPVDGASYKGTFSPDSSMVAFANGKIRDARTGEPIQNLSRHNNSYTISFSPDSKHTISSHRDGGARIFEPRTGKSVTTLRHQHPVSSASYSPDGKTIITASAAGELNLWDAVSYQPLRKFELKDEKVSSAKFSENGRWILCHTNFGNTYVWDPHFDTAPFLVAKAQNRYQYPAISPDGTLLLTAQGIRDGRIILRNIVPSQPMVQTFRHKESLNWDAGSQFVSVVNFSPSGDRIITGATENEVGIWDAWTGKRLQNLNQGGGVKFRAAFSPDGELALTTSNKNGLAIWDSRDGQRGKIHSRNPYGMSVHAAFSPTKNAQGHYYLVNAPQGGNTAFVYNATTREAVGEPLTMEDDIEFQVPLGCFNAAFSPDSTHLATASCEGHARIWSIADSEMVLELTGQHALPVTTLNYSPDGRQIVTASDDGTAVIWDAESGAVIHRLRHGSSPLNYAEFSPDNQSVVTTSRHGLAKIWNAQTGQQQGEPLKHDGFVRTARFSSDSLRVVTCSFDNTARLWDAQTGLPLSGPFHHEGDVFWATFSPDGTRVATSGSDTLARIWDFPPAPRTRVPDWVPEWAEAVAGMRIDGNNAVKTIPHKERQQILDSVLAHPDDHYYAKTAKWLASEQDARPITPFSKMSKETWVQNRLTENTVESLEEALAADPHDSDVALALAKALLDSSTGDRLTNLGQAAILADQGIGSPHHESLHAEIQSARAAHAFDQRVARLEEEAIASAEIGETSSLAPLHKTLILAKFLAQSDDNLKLTTELRSPQELIDIEFRDSGPQVFLAKDSTWHYLDDDQPPPPNWTSPDFNHDWESGPAPLGYGEDQATLLKGEETYATAFYFRQSFDHQKHPSIAKPTLSIRCDDGAVIYLNGEELLRFRMPDGKITHETQAAIMAGATGNEKQWHDFVIEPGLLKEKDNLLAVEIHQKHTRHNPSSDLYLALEFSYRHSEASYLKQFDTDTLTRGLSQLSLTLPPELAPVYQQRWQSAILPGVLPDDRESLDLRAKFLKRLQRYDDELAALNQLITLYPISTDYAEFIIHINCLRRISECLHTLGREDESLAYKARISTTIPLRPENLSPLQLDLTDHFNINFFQIKRPPFWGSLAYWGERIPELFDPGDGPEFDVRGVIQLNSGKYSEGPDWLIEKSFSHASAIPALNKIDIEVNQTFGAIHFLQTCHHLREHVGTEIAHYLIHYEDGFHERIPVIVGEGIAGYKYKQSHPSVIENVRHLAFEKSFKWNQWNNDSSKFGLCRQSWTNPHPKKQVTHLEYVSERNQAAPCLLAVTVEPEEEVAERNRDLPQKLQDLEEQLENIPDSLEPTSIRKRRNLLRQVVPILEDLAKHDEARKLADEIFSIPPRPEGLSPKQIDLTSVYTESYFLPGINLPGVDLPKYHRTLNWSRIPEEFQAVNNPRFDVRGVIRLNSGAFPRGSYRDGQNLDTIWPNHCPDQIRIPIGQKFQTIHFLQTCGYWKVEEGEEVAQYILHYEDGTEESISVNWDKNTFNYDHVKIEEKSLAQSSKIAHTFTLKGKELGDRRISLICQSVKNLHPNKLVTHLDFVSGKKSTGPVLAGITVE